MKYRSKNLRADGLKASAAKFSAAAVAVGANAGAAATSTTGATALKFKTANRLALKLRATAFLLVLTLAFVFSSCAVSPQNALENTAKALDDYKIEAVYKDETKTISAVETFTFKNAAGIDTDKLCFNLYANAYRERAKYKAIATAYRTQAYPYGASWGYIDITYVKVGGVHAVFNIEGDDQNILTVALNAATNSATKAEPAKTAALQSTQITLVEIGFTVALANVYDRLGYNADTVNITNWYPVLCVFKDGAFVFDDYSSYGDPFFSESSNYEVSLTYPKKFGIAHTGTLANETDTGDTLTADISARCVRDFAVVLNLSKKVASGEIGGVKVNYHYFSDENFAAALEVALKAMDTFSKLFGSYPYGEVNIVQTRLVHGGMEYPNLVMVASNLAAADALEVVVHELAHQWWYGVVGNDQLRAAWLDEGLTDFSTLLFFSTFEEYGIDREQRVRDAQINYALFSDVLADVNKTTDTTMTRALSEYSSEREYYYMTYVKGMLMFDTLYKSIGEKAFLNCIKRYYTDNMFKIAGGADIIASFKRAGKRVDTFFSAWLDGKVIIARLNG
jgi:hypothetical protein